MNLIDRSIKKVSNSINNNNTVSVWINKVVNQHTILPLDSLLCKYIQKCLQLLYQKVKLHCSP